MSNVFLGIKSIVFVESHYAESLTGVLMAHGFHFLSVHMLYQLSLCINPDRYKLTTPKFAFLAACLHVISPAGFFLSAPYAESPFSFFNIAGFFLYAKSRQRRSGGNDWICDILLAASGIIFSIACMFRSNGLLSGLIFCHEAIDSAVALLLRQHLGVNLRRLCAAFLAGSLMAFGPITWQYLAYRKYCVNTETIDGRRPWCSKWVPSIYTWVQSYYW